jgi:hypothetical protein
MQLEKGMKVIHWLCVPKHAAITASAGLLSACALVLLSHFPKTDSSWVRVRTHTFRHAVIEHEINPMSCMSGPFNVCVEGGRVKSWR